MDFSNIVFIFLSVLMLIPTIASLTKFDEWWVRAFDFPRIQIIFLILVVLIITMLISPYEELWQIILTGLLAISLIYQLIKIFPYTLLSRKQVLSFHGNDPKAIISILVSNVLTTNTRYDKLIDLVNSKKPDVLLTLETDKKWEEELSTLEKDYPFTVKIPLDNLYGMHLYSKLKLEDYDVKYLIKEDIPSIHGYLRLNNNTRVKFHALHPQPPSPTEDPTSTNRDAE
ncbi:MAG TPA: endonuclease/exonuclease/phosphatase family protein, partial [Gillisia sp.]|nr:endonuclease/exonuclease/phosphatase family protein [Gillisia sp.]